MTYMYINVWWEVLKCEQLGFVLIQVSCVLQRQNFIIFAILINVVVSFKWSFEGPNSLHARIKIRQTWNNKMGEQLC